MVPIGIPPVAYLLLSTITRLSGRIKQDMIALVDELALYHALYPTPWNIVRFYIKLYVASNFPCKRMAVGLPTTLGLSRIIRIAMGYSRRKLSLIISEFRTYPIIYMQVHWIDQLKFSR